jgi:hypothetical protein
MWKGFTEVRRRRERERERQRVRERDGNILPHISGRDLLKSGTVERERQRETGR